MLAIGIDAGEPSLVQQMMSDGLLPRLQALARAGEWGRVASPANLGSGAVWPTFITGDDPRVHGIYSAAAWNRGAMTVEQVNVDGLAPFWTDPRFRERNVGVLDVPFSPPARPARGVIVTEWGTHDAIRRCTEIAPRSVQSLVAGATQPHPFSIPPLEGWGEAEHEEELEPNVQECLAGVSRRAALGRRLMQELSLDTAIVIFAEVHRASHLLWHTVEPDGKPVSLPAVRDGLRTIYRAVDDAIGELVDEAGPEACVLVFSLHGMRATGGIPAVLAPVFEEHGYAIPTTWAGASWRQRSRWMVDGLKARSPKRIKQLYRGVVPDSVAIRIEGPERASCNYDWRFTRAFPLPTDQHGWIRINLEGREARGVVPERDYRRVCDEIEDLVCHLETGDGQPLVADLVRIADDTGAPPDRLPDLVVHWSAAATAPEARIARYATNLSGQHAPDGFFVFRAAPGSAKRSGDCIQARDIHRLLCEAVQK